MVMFFSVKNWREQATSQRLHFAMSRKGFGKGMNTFFPDSSNSLSDFGHLSAFLESVLHSPHECLVSNTKFSVVLFQFYSSRSYIFFELIAIFVWVCAGSPRLSRNKI